MSAFRAEVVALYDALCFLRPYLSDSFSFSVTPASSTYIKMALPAMICQGYIYIYICIYMYVYVYVVGHTAYITFVSCRPHLFFSNSGAVRDQSQRVMEIQAPRLILSIVGGGLSYDDDSLSDISSFSRGLSLFGFGVK